MSERYPQVKKLADPTALRERCAELGLDIPIDEEVDPDGPLAQPFTFRDGATGDHGVANRFTILPMEGWDGTTTGGPTELVERRWRRFGASGAGLVWAEATAVVADGRANPNQLVMTPANADALGALRRSMLDAHATRFGGAIPPPVIGLQLTHSGRWSRPNGAPVPRLAHDHPALASRTAPGGSVFSDEELDGLADAYVEAATLAARAGFEFVDVKHCHGYLLHELLSGIERVGRYGGSFDGRTAFLRRVAAGIRDRAPGVAVAVRLSAYDLAPFGPGDDRVGVPQHEAPYPWAFGGDGTGVGIDLTETHAFVDVCRELGIGLVSITAGSPYYNPHVQRPAYFPPSDGYRPPEDPLVGVARMLAATRELAARHPDIAFVTGGMSYLQDWIAHVGQRVIAGGGATSVGLGRMALSYPDLPADVLAGRPLNRHLVCRTLSDCTTAPRNGLISGCFPLDDFYKQRPERTELATIKRRLRE